MIKYSVIIPHKNTPKLLLRCINSIPHRDDVEIIVVDDKSDEVIEFDNPFVKFIYKEEGRGAGFARNIGLSIAKGKWVVFADADDFFLNDAFDIIFSHYNSSADIIFFGTSSSYSDTQISADKNEYYSKLIKDYHCNKKGAEDKLRYNFFVPWGKIFRRDMILENEIFFDEVIASNDVMFSVKTGFFAKEINVDNREIYNYSISSGSLTNRRSKEVLLSRYCVALRYNDFLKSIGKERYASLIPIYFLFKSFNYGIKEFYSYWKLGVLYKQFFYIPYYYWAIIRSIRSFFKQFRKNKRDRKYVITE